MNLVVHLGNRWFGNTKSLLVLPNDDGLGVGFPNQERRNLQILGLMLRRGSLLILMAVNHAFSYATNPKAARRLIGEAIPDAEANPIDPDVTLFLR